MKLTGIFLIFFLLTQSVKGQSNFVEVKGLPTKEVFDLLVDRKGFLWVAHNLGISRYDGISFTHFSHPLQSALSMTDLIEDPQGRIWCHNFNGQIFYIEKERMHLLEEYNYKKEATFPRMVLFEDELIATSSHGLFVCDTKTLKGRYLKAKGTDSSSTQSLVLLDNKVIASELNKWYSYDKEQGFVKITDISNPKIEMKRYSYHLSPSSFKDTIHFIINPKGWLYKIVAGKNTIKMVDIQPQGSFINSVSVDHGKVWINTTTYSKTSGNEVELKDYNISDHATDQQGNHWISTLDRGVLVNFKTSTWKKIEFTELAGNDFVRHLATYKNSYLIGTKNGQLLLMDINTKEITWKYSFPASHAGIEFIKQISPDKFLVSTSNRLFVFDVRTKAISVWAYFTARGADNIGEDVLIASPVGFYLLAPLDQKIELNSWYQSRKKMFPSLDIGYHESGILYKEIRSRTIRYNHATKTIYVSLKGELWEIGSFGMKPLRFRSNPINASALEYVNDKMYIATLDGLLIQDGSKMRQLTVNDGLSSNVIINMKRTGNYLWLFLNNTIQVYDLNYNKIIENLDLPQISGANIYDVVATNDTAYLTAEDGIYMVPLKNHPQSSHKTYLTSVLVNNKDTLLGNRFTLPYNKNSVQFNLSVPWFHPSHNIHFRYRLKGENQTGAWYTTNEQENTIQFAALMPGEYVFESYAVISGNPEDSPLTISFTIEPPWWKQVWFVSLALLLIFVGLYIAYRMRLRQVLKVEKIRRNISSDLHDEIGSTLSSINIYSELAKKENDNEEYLGLIQNNVREVITKLDDLVWSINPRNDSFKQLISRMQLFADPLLLNSNIHYSFEYDPELLKLELSVDVKQNLYLIFKESINNIAKHSKAGHCDVSLRYKKPYLWMQIKDNGAGFSPEDYLKGRNGLKNIQERAKQMNASLELASHPGKGTDIQLKVPIT